MPSEPQELSFLEAISAALRDAMRTDPSVVLLGQDIAEYGGAFKVTRGFIEEFGRERVINTPIAESGMIGAAIGAAVLGLRPVVEMQFSDFVTCGFNQVVNVAAKMYWRTGTRVPLVLRCPVGAGAGAGPFHSQSMEAWFTHVPGLKVVYPSEVADAYGLLRAAIADPNPVVFFEHKHLYRRLKAPREELDGEPKARVEPTARFRLEGEDAVVITYGRCVHLALEAAQRLGGDGHRVGVLDVSTLAPLASDVVLEGVKRANRVLVVHEATLTGGFGGEIVARIAAEAFEYLDAPVRRLAFPDSPVPFHRSLEEHALPRAETITEALRDLLEW